MIGLSSCFPVFNLTLTITNDFVLFQVIKCRRMVRMVQNTLQNNVWLILLSFKFTVMEIFK